MGPVGFAPVAPGTWGALLGLIIGFLVLQSGLTTALILTVFAILIAHFACQAYLQSDRGVDPSSIDPSEVICDEVAGQMLALFLVACFVPVSLTTLVVAFVLFRLFDILKPWPVNWAEGFEGAYGVMADDLVAGLMAGIGTVLISWALSGLGLSG